MNTEQSTELRNRLAQLGPRDRKELNKLAAEKRTIAQRKAGGHDSKWTVEQWMLALLRAREPMAQEAPIVVSVFGANCLVDDRLGSRVVKLHHRIEGVVPGDRVRLDGETIREVFPRKTLLTRRNPSKVPPRLPIVANVELICVVVSSVAPPLHPRLIDRYLAASRKGGCASALVLNKIDLHETENGLDEDRAKLGPYIEMAVPTLEVSTVTGSGIAELRQLLSGKFTAFVGHSGVGKSSLLNSLLPEAAMVTGQVDCSGRGRHTTTASALHRLGDITIIDTPGIREFGVEFADVSEVSECFEDFPVGCRFANCLHLSEEGCVVKVAVVRGQVSRARYESYRRLLLDAFPKHAHTT